MASKIHSRRLTELKLFPLFWFVNSFAMFASSFVAKSNEWSYVFFLAGIYSLVGIVVSSAFLFLVLYTKE